jgi:hypothetical protein
MQLLLDNPRILSQHVDTLKTSHRVEREDDYENIYKPFLEELENYKREAQAIQETSQSSRFITKEILGMGTFCIYAQGSGVYKYRISNEDIDLKIGKIPFGSTSRPQVLVEYRQAYLFLNGHKKAYELVCIFLRKFMGSLVSGITEIHLATDIWGIKYTHDDASRFQTNFKACEISKIEADGAGRTNKRSSSKQSNIATIEPIIEVVSTTRRLETFSFGKGSFMFRIYDKLSQTKNTPDKRFLFESKWKLNGYDASLNAPVFRHEIQLRDLHLKRHINPRASDKVLYGFSKLNQMWEYAISKFEYVPLTLDEISRVKDMTSTDSINSVYKRAKKDEDRYSFWHILKTWDNAISAQTIEYKDYKAASFYKAEKYGKMFISSVYKNVGCNIKHTEWVIDEIDRKLRNFEGKSLHEYACEKVIGSFTENKRAIEKFGAVPDSSTHADDIRRYEEALSDTREVLKTKGKDNPYLNDSSADYVLSCLDDDTLLSIRKNLIMNTSKEKMDIFEQRQHDATLGAFENELIKRGLIEHDDGFGKF